MLFERYQTSSKTIVPHMLHSCSLGGIASGFSLLILLSTTPAERILPWTVFGVTLGMILVLAGAFFLHRVTPASRWGQWLTARSNRWFPLFLFLMQKTFFTLFAILLWAVLYHLGVPFSWFRNILFFLLLFLLPIKSVVREQAVARPAQRMEILNDLFHYLAVAISTLLTVSIITSLTISPTSSPTDLNMIDILLWILALLVLAICLILFLSRFPRHRPHPSRPQKRSTVFFIQNSNKPEY